MGSTSVREKMRSFGSSVQKRSRLGITVAARRRSVMHQAIETMEKRVLFAVQPFTPGDIVVEQYGDGSTALSSAAAPIILDEYTPAGTLVQQIPLPTSGGSALTGSGSSTAEGFLTLSTDGHYLEVPGYGAASGQSTVINTTTTGAYTISSITGGATTVATTPSGGGATVMATAAPLTPVTIAGNAEVTAGTTYYAKQLTAITFQLYTDQAGTSPLTSTAATVTGGTANGPAVLRAIGRIDSSGNIDTSTTLGTGTLSTYAIRGAATVSGSSIYYDGSGSASSDGVVPFGGATAPTYLGAQNSRAIGIFGGNLFISTASGTVGIDEVGALNSGLPTTTSTTLTNVINTNASFGTLAASPYGFYFATLNPGDTSPDTLYVEDSTKGLFKYTGSIGGSWTLNSVTNSSTNTLAGTGLTATQSGSTVTLYITTPTSVEQLIDSSGYGNAVTASATKIASIGTTLTANEAYRGVALVPQPTGAPTIAAQPPATTPVYVGATATITSLAYGTGITSQWQVSTNGGASYSNISDGTLYSGTQTTTLSILNAQLSENGYMYRELFTNASGGPVASNPSTLSVTNTPEFSFNSSTYSVTENVSGGLETITVTRGGDTSGSGSVNYNTTNGTAVAGTNYTAVSGTLSFPGGATSESFNVPIKAVVPQGGNVTFNVNLYGQSTGSVLGTPATSVVTIVDTQEIFNLSTGSYTVNDTDATGVISVLRSGAFVGDAASVPFTVSGAFSASGTATFVANQIVSAGKFTIPANSTSGNETVTITLGTPTVTSGLPSVGATTTATDTIVHNVSNATTVSTTAASTSDIETSGYYGSSYAPLVGDITAGTGTFGYYAYEILEFSPGSTPTVYPAPGTTVNANGITNLSIQLYNTDNTAGDNYNGIDGNFNVYFIPDSDATTPSGAGSKLVYNSSAYQNGLTLSQFTAAPVLIGTFSFSDTAGYDTYTAASIPSSVESALVSDLNTGTNFRFAITPQATGIGSIAADFKGVTPGLSPIVSFNAAETTTKTLETFNFSSGAYSESEAGPNVTITITRGGSTIADSATIMYSTSDASAIAGTNYTATSGTATFAAGVSTYTFTVPAIAVARQNGDKTLNLTLSTPTTTGNTVGVLGSQSTATLTIIDTSTAPTEVISPYVVGSANVEVKSIYDDTEFKAGGTNAAYPSFGTIDFSDSGSGPTNTITGLDSITLAINNVQSTVSALSAGTVDFYLATTSTPLVVGATTPYYNASNGIEGVGTQLGSLMYLGTFNLTDINPSDSQTISLAGFSASTEQTLISYLNSGTSFRLLMTPETAGVNADFDPGSANLAIKVQEGTVVTTPSWLSSDSVVTSYTPGSSITLSSGTIIADPASAGDSGIAITVSGGTLNTNLPTGVHTIHAGAVTVASGSTFSLRYNSTTLSTSVPVLITTGLSISSTGSVDEANGDIDLQGGSVGTLNAYVKQGFANGLWNGLGGIDSTVAAASHTNAIGVAPGGAVVSISGVTTASTDAVAKYTFFGDADLSGHVDGSDYSRIDSAFVTGGMTGWYNGDFNYDGKINGSDYTLIDNAFNMEGTTTIAAQVAAAKPERTTAVSDAQVATVTNAVFSKKKLSMSIFEQLEQEISTH